jgi:CMP/dCMP kinase
MKIPQTIAIDGPAASGKSTLGALLAKDLGYLYFDTGVMYRAVTLAALRAGLDIFDDAAITALAEQVRIDVAPPSVKDGRAYDVLLDGEDVTWAIRTDAVNDYVSDISTYAGVRKALTDQQRRIAMENKVVMVGRDIGTVVIPDADLKIFLDASVEVRAQRRYQEMLDRGETPDYEAVLRSVKKPRSDRFEPRNCAAKTRRGCCCDPCGCTGYTSRFRKSKGVCLSCVIHLLH